MSARRTGRGKRSSEYVRRLPGCTTAAASRQPPATTAAQSSASGSGKAVQGCTGAPAHLSTATDQYRLLSVREYSCLLQIGRSASASPRRAAMVDCGICFESFDELTRTPKMVPCGHTVCFKCLQEIGRNECPTCRAPFRGAFNSLPNNHSLLQLMESRRSGSGRPPPPLSWCFSCGAAAAPGCGAGHEVLPAGEALWRQLRGVLPQAAGELLGFQNETKAEQALQALALLTADSCDVTARLELVGTVSNTKDPVVKCVWLDLGTSFALTQKQVSKQQQEPPAAPAKEPPADLPKDPPADLPKEPPANTPKEPPAAQASAAVLRELNIAANWPDCWRTKDEELLRAVTGVGRLLGVRCSGGNHCPLRDLLLKTAAPSVEELSIDGVSNTDLVTVHAMPRLRRLEVSGDTSLREHTGGTGHSLPSLSAGRCGLTWLHVHSGGLPLYPMISLLQAHAHTLETLQLRMGTETDKEWNHNHRAWPWSSYELVNMLQRVLGHRKMTALRRVLVLRKTPVSSPVAFVLRHDKTACAAHLAAVRWHLLGVQVQCDICDGIAADCPDCWRTKDEELLRAVSGVGRLLGVRCSGGIHCPLRDLLLKTAAPSVEELSIDGVRWKDLLTVQAMPRLRRLEVSGDPSLYQYGGWGKGPTLPSLSAGQCGLTWLHVHSSGLSLNTMISLLLAHAHTLETLQLRMGTETCKEWLNCGGWPWSSYELVNVLRSVLWQTELTALRRVLVLRKTPVSRPVPFVLRHDKTECAAHLTALRWCLFGAQVQCDICDDVDPEEL
ncbi:Roquin-1 [Frankliniella fusca]|uniref:Roquin-1 n=1 Tax=Frankliniella fusca TaxID=407009 RepID=A0AAE1HVP8_9NEOP|nr:Roquin-1 [Frankliniella fusca]